MNETLFYYINSLALRYDWLDQALLFFSEYFGWVVIVSLITFLATHRHNRKEGVRNILVVFFAAILAWGIAHLFKYFYFSPRPFEALDGVNLVFAHGNGDSLPSGHATFFSALAVSVFCYHRSLGALYAIFALLIGISRVAVGIHWPVDILVGYLLGGIIGYVAYKLSQLCNWGG